MGIQKIKPLALSFSAHGGSDQTVMKWGGRFSKSFSRIGGRAEREAVGFCSAGSYEKHQNQLSWLSVDSLLTPPAANNKTVRGRFNLHQVRLTGIFITLDFNKDSFFTADDW